MNMRTVHRSVLAILAWLLLAATAHAGRSCEESRQTVGAIEQGLNLAEQTMKLLDASGHKLVILARAGQDLSKYGVRYSHLGVAYRHPDGTGGHAWRVVHKLNQCATAVASLYRQGLGEFFLDDPWRYEAAYIAPSAEAQAKLLALLRDERRIAGLHHRPYSIVSYAWGSKYQQSNQWITETLAFSMDSSIADRAGAQQWLQAQGYEPAVLQLGPLTRLGGRISAANVAFDDHPLAKRFSDRIETVTADSVFRWLERADFGGKLVTIRLK